MLKCTLLSAWDVGNYRFFCVSFWVLRETLCSRALHHVGAHSPELCLSCSPSLSQSLGCPPCLHTLAPLGPCRVLFSLISAVLGGEVTGRWVGLGHGAGLE